MSYTSFLKPLFTSLIIGAALSSAQGFAAGKIIYQEEAVEAERIQVFIPKGSQNGTVQISGCEGCPMTLTVDGATGFFYQRKPANSNRVTFLSGKSGTVIFDKEQKRALRILW